MIGVSGAVITHALYFTNSLPFAKQLYSYALRSTENLTTTKNINMPTVDAKIRDIEEKPDDIFFLGNVVVSESNNVVLITNSAPTISDVFTGVIVNGDYKNIGIFCDQWLKSRFTQFTGIIEITVKP